MPTGPLWEFRPICLTASSSAPAMRDRKSTRLNSSHSQISYAVFCLKKKKLHNNRTVGRKPKRCDLQGPLGRCQTHSTNRVAVYWRPYDHFSSMRGLRKALIGYVVTG